VNGQIRITEAGRNHLQQIFQREVGRNNLEILAAATLEASLPAAAAKRAIGANI